MTQALILSSASQQRIAEEAEAQATKAHAKAKKSLGWSLGGFAASLAVGAVFPPAFLPGVLMVVGAAVGLMSGAYAAGHALNERFLRKAKEESTGEGFTAKMQKRASRLNKIFRRADRISDFSLYGALALATLALLAPPVAPAAWSLYSLAIGVMGVTALTSAATRDPSKGVSDLSKMVTNLATADTLSAQIKPANENQPVAPALVNAPAPAKDFDKAVNGPVADAPAPAPVKAPAPPKP